MLRIVKVYRIKISSVIRNWIIWIKIFIIVFTFIVVRLFWGRISMGFARQNRLLLNCFNVTKVAVSYILLKFLLCPIIRVMMIRIFIKLSTTIILTFFLLIFVEFWLKVLMILINWVLVCIWLWIVNYTHTTWAKRTIVGLTAIIWSEILLWIIVWVRLLLWIVYIIWSILGSIIRISPLPSTVSLIIVVLVFIIVISYNWYSISLLNITIKISLHSISLSKFFILILVKILSFICRPVIILFFIVFILIIFRSITATMPYIFLMAWVLLNRSFLCIKLVFV